MLTGRVLASSRYPVIAIIIVGGLIVLSIVWCIARCACCGMSFCCECFYCLKCCGNCCGCCSTPGGKRHKYLDEPYIPPNQGYRPEAPMVAPAAIPSFTRGGMGDGMGGGMGEDRLAAVAARSSPPPSTSLPSTPSST